MSDATQRRLRERDRGAHRPRDRPADRGGPYSDGGRAAALKKFGNVTSARERFHESRRLMWLEDGHKDTALALRRHPGYAAAAIVERQVFARFPDRCFKLPVGTEWL